MTNIVERVDHPVVAVHDLEASRGVFERLGFVVPPSGRHREWGTANVCIMFPRDYLEIRGIADPTKFLAGMDEFLKHGEGFCSVAFNCANAEVSYKECLAAGLGAQAPRELNRKLELRDRTLELRFCNVMLDKSLYPGLTHANLCQHLTPDTLRQPEWLEHPNGATGFNRLVGVVSDFDEAHAAYTSLLGENRVFRKPDRLMIACGSGAIIELITAEEALQRGDAQPALGDAYLAAATIGVRDLGALKALLDRNGVRYRSADETAVAVNPADACGARLYFEQAEA